MADQTYGPKVYHKQDGNEQVVAYGRVLNVETGGVIKANGTQGAALTAQLTTITPADAEGTPDYAIAGLTTTAGVTGFASLQEAVTVLYVIRNLQVLLA